MSQIVPGRAMGWAGLLLLLSIGCAGNADGDRETVADAGGENSQGGESGATSTLQGGGGGDSAYEIDPNALVGCRAPDEPGCSTCCVPTDDGQCQTYTSHEDWSRYPEIEPWYNAIGSLREACPTDCAPCATCSEASENRVHSLAARDCDCEHLPPGGEDACFDEESCECYCEETSWLFKVCPAAP